MRYILATLIVALALIGAASAWEERNYLDYTFVKEVDTQAGENLPWFAGTTSGAQYNEPNGAYGVNSASVFNNLITVAAAPATLQGQAVNTHDKLVQYGSAVSFMQSPDPEKPCEIKEYAKATSGSQMKFSGLYTGAVAEFDNQATVTTAGKTATTFQETAAGHHNAIALEAEPAGSPGAGTVFIEGTVGSEASIDITKTMDAFSPAKMSGSFMQFGSFSGAYNAVTANGPVGMDVETRPFDQVHLPFLPASLVNNIGPEQHFEMT